MRNQRQFTVWLGLLLFMGVPFGIFSQSAPETAPEASPSGLAASQTPPTSPKSEDQLIDDSVEADIRTADYDDLVFWCRRLGMDFSGTKSELQARLRALYGIESAGSSSASGNQIQIQAAEKTEYYKIDEINQDYIRIIGNVAVVLEESAPDGGASPSSHKITSDYIIFNKKEQILTAHGNVLYEKRTGETVETFSGNSLVFNIENWQGVIYKGVSQRDQAASSEGSSPGGGHTFYYSGDKLIKGKDDKIKMIQGKISSGKSDFPVFSISADKIWVLAPGEWGIQGATLQVGEVPLLYIPFFLKKGDKFIFNPSVGQNEDIGSFLNMTYYFLGKKNEEDSTDSFNFLDPSGGKGTGETWVDGLFLRNGKKPDFSAADTDSAAQSDAAASGSGSGDSADSKPLTEVQKKYREWKEDLSKEWDLAKANENTYLKLMADAYSNIGQFVGLQGKISGMSNLKNFDFRAGLGLSYYGIHRDSLSKGMEVQLLHQMIDPALGLTEDNLVSYYGMVPDHSYFFGFLVPFRYGLEANLEYANPTTYSNTKLKMDLYSDSLYPEHFTKYRQESFNLEQAIGLSEEKPFYQDATRISKLNWYLENSFNGLQKLFPKEVHSRLSSFSLSKLNFNLEFISDVFDDTLIHYLGPDVSHPATVKKEYFVPSQMLIPDINVNFSGTLFNTKYDRYGNRNGIESALPQTETKPLSESRAKAVKPPWGEKPAEKPEKKQRLKTLPLFPNVPIRENQFSTLFSHQLDYNFKTLNLQLLGNFIHETPATPKTFHQLAVSNGAKGSPGTGDPLASPQSIINFQLSKLTVKLRGEADMNYRASLLDNLMSLTDNLSFSSDYQKNFLSNQVMDIKDADGNLISGNDRNHQIQETLYRQEALADDRKNSRLRLNHQFNLKMQPLRFFKGFEGSSVSYNLAHTLLDYRYQPSEDRFVAEAGVWDPDHVSSHTLNTLFQFKLLDQNQSLSLQFLLPPRQATVSPALDLNFGFFTDRLSFSAYKNFTDTSRLDENSSPDGFNPINEARNQRLEDRLNGGRDNWFIRDVSNNASFQFNNGISFSNQFQYDVLHERLTHLETRFSANFLDNQIAFNQQLRVVENNGEVVPDRVSLNLKLWFLNLTFNATKGQPQFFDWNSVSWVNDPLFQPQLVPQTIHVDFDYHYQSPPLWKNRIKVGFDIKTGIHYNFVRFTESALRFALGLDVDIHRLLTVNFTVQSKNEALYLYSPDLVKKLNHGLSESQAIQPLSFFDDLFSSFGNTEQRKASNFNLASINFSLTHHLGEWDLVFKYSGSPSTRNLSSGYETASMSWKRNFSISVVWGAINMIKTDIEMNEENNLTF